MTQQEWEQHSEEWRRGYSAYAHNETIVDYDAKSHEWKDGFDYAVKTVGAGPQ